MSSLTQKVVLIAGAFLIVLGGIGAAIYGKHNERQQTLAEVEKLRQEIAGYDKRIALREMKRKQKEDIEDNFAELVEILPQASPQQQDRIYQLLTQIGANTKVKAKGITEKATTTGGAAPPAGGKQQPQAPQAPQFGDAFQQTQLSASFEGTFSNFMRFLNMVENYPNFLRVDEIDIRPSRTVVTDPQTLDIKLTLSTFSYVVR